MSKLRIYVDGSQVIDRDNNYPIGFGYGVVVFHENRLIDELSGGVTFKRRQFAPLHWEFIALVEACLFALNNAFKPQDTTICADYHEVANAAQAMRLGRHDATRFRVLLNVWHVSQELHDGFRTYARVVRFLNLCQTTHVKAHSGDLGNGRADYLARRGVRQALSLQVPQKLEYQAWSKIQFGHNKARDKAELKTELRDKKLCTADQACDTIK